MNPCNNRVYNGWMVDKPIIIRNEKGSPYQARFTLKVKREYRNKNNRYDYDYIPMRLFGESRLKLIENIKKGDALAISGAMRSGCYEKDGNKIYEIYVNVDSISFSPKNSEKSAVEGTNQQKKSNTFISDIMEEFDLPFK